VGARAYHHKDWTIFALGKMKIAGSCLKEDILHATPSEIIRESQKNGLEESWDNLSLIYTEKLQSSTKELTKTMDLFNKICLSRVELETGRKVYELIKSNIISNIEGSFTAKRFLATLKPATAKFCDEIVLNARNDLEKAMHVEKSIWGRVKSLGKDRLARLVDGKIRIYLNDELYVILSTEGSYIYPTTWIASGLTCTLEYGSFTFKGSLDPREGDDVLERVEEYIREQNIIQEYDKDGLKIKVCRGISDEKDGLCVFLLKALKGGKRIDELREMITTYLSRIVIRHLFDCVLQRDYIVVNCYGERMVDGLRSTFICMSKGDRIKVVRCMTGFQLYWNEIPMKIKSVPKKSE
jgi:hypothetical protein